MPEKDKDRTRDNSRRHSAIKVVGLGPGGLEDLTLRAKAALEAADCVVGYTRYVDLVRPLIEGKGKEVFSTGMTHEVERCEKAIAIAKEGKLVAVVSSGDSGIYGMAGLIFELLSGDGTVEVEVIPGVPAFVAAASLLGAPLMHDFASISLSDLLTDWDLIEARLEAASKADFVIALYNPKSSKRIEGLIRAIDVIGRSRAGATPVGIVRNASRKDEEVIVTTLADALSFAGKIDMLTILIIGNSSTYSSGGRMITPRGYKLEGKGR
ncbi:MAG: precorrin-3B C(17)-methyltransferase [Deltaproteobacteria bacterium]|nr:precorrin-3B C(17)-methyltransferase [Deltaproteobacteria bacterium]